MPNPLFPRFPLRRGGRLLLCRLSLSLVILLVAGGAEAQNLERLARDLTAIEGDLASLARTPLRAEAIRSPTYVEERLTDGELSC
ncbi:MAG: hypothetical protein AAF938_16645 [Myxococcota bacterium]